jgi:nucleoside triphosphate diphosphatase
MTPSKDIARLIEIMAALRTPVTGCPWDLEQTFATIAPYTLEEAFEVADAIERGDLADLKDELGDLLLQVVYHSRMAEEQGAFQFGDVVEGVSAKMIRRHPHVFGDETAGSASAVNGLWDRIKAEERRQKHLEKDAAPHPRIASSRAATGSGAGSSPLPAELRGEGIRSILDDVPLALPGLTRAIKLQNKAAKVGFDWPGLAPVFEKMREELAELEEVVLAVDDRHSPSAHTSWGEGRGEGQQQASEQAVSPHPNPLPAKGRGEGTHRAAMNEEFGDLLFVMANVARHLEIDPEAALRAANQKFTRRFHHIEARLAEQGSSPAQSTLEEMDALWDEAKVREKEV